AEIYAIAREALSAGQRGFQFQSYPFRMTAENLAKHRLDPNIGFWKNLKEGSDTFDISKEELRVAVANRRYLFNADESTVAAVTQKQRHDEQEVADLIAKGEKPIRLVYNDGDTHESFREALANASGVSDTKLGFVSRTEGISSGPRQIALDDSGREKIDAPSTALAFASLKEVPASQPETRQAVTQQTAPVAVAAASSQETPFYKKMLGGVADLFGTSASQPVAETVQVAPAPAKAAPATKAMPQKRAQGSEKVNLAAAN
ncbi:hypothetical protein KBI52_20610, partial [Microvirga sp. HBU67558]|nr:hypothetical protein [Microvirga sp. HBU67558]